MAFIPVPNTALVVVGQRLAAQRLVNTLWFEKNTPWSEAELVLLATDVSQWWDLELSGQLGNDIFLDDVVATSQQSATAPQGAATGVFPQQGTVAQEVLPGGVALTVTFRTALRGRSYRGRNFVAGMPVTVISDGIFTQTSVDLVVQKYEELPGYVAPEGATHVVVSKVQEGVPLSQGVTTPIIAYTADTAVDSQRRRNVGRGD